MGTERAVRLTQGKNIKVFNSAADCGRFLYGDQYASSKGFMFKCLKENRVIKGWNIEYFDKSPYKHDFKRLFFDIETSPNIVYSWRIGRKIYIDHENIINERAIICICWKWEGQDEINAVRWKDGDDREMLIKFAEVFNSADEIVGQNSESFDIKWFRTRCLYHRIPVNPRIVSLDTLQIAIRKFNFNSNKLEYMGKFLGFGGKIKTDFDLWKQVLNGNKKALAQMIDYCKRDVDLLEKVFNELFRYTEHRSHVAVELGRDKIDCPKCGSIKHHFNRTHTTKMGIVRVQMQCNECAAYYTVSNRTYLDSLKHIKEVTE